MKKLIGKLITAILMFSVVSGCASSPFADDAVSRMSKEELKQRLGAPDVIILDTRTGSDWNGSDQIIPGAVRAEPKEFSKWAEAYPKDATIVLY
jgi:hypothetical protein